MSLSRALPAIVLLLLTGCAGDPFSEVVVIVDADDGIAMDAVEVRLRLWSGDEIPDGEPDVPVVEELVTVGPGGDYDFPFSFGVSPMGNDASRRFRVEAAAFPEGDRTTPLAVARATTGFVSGEIRQLLLRLEEDCREVECDPPLTCRAGRCANAEVDETTLPPYGVVGCGDGVVGLDEDCDDANLRDGDGCSATCTREGSCDSPIDLTVAGATLSDGTIVYYGSTEGQIDDGKGDCAMDSEDGADVVLQYVPEEDGRIEVSTEGSDVSFSTVLHARSNCTLETTQLACNRAVMPGFAHSRMALDVEEGEPIYIFVDGRSATAGEFQLTLQRSGAPGTDCSEPTMIELDTDGTFSATGTTIGGLDSATGTCAPSPGAPDKVYVFVPEADGRLGATTHFGAGSFDTVLYARSTCDADMSELACNEDIATGFQGSWVTFDVTADTPVYLFVDGASATTLGTYQLDVWYAPEASTCDAAVDISLGPDDTFTDMGSNRRSFDDLAPSADCAPSSNAPERVYSFSDTRSGRYVVSTGGAATIDTVVSVREQCVAGPELLCNDDVQTGFQRSRVQGYYDAAAPIFVVVDGRQTTTLGDYELEFRFAESPVPGTCEPGAAESLTLTGTDPVTMIGSTASAFDDGTGTCAGDEELGRGSFDVVYEVSTPAPGRVGLSTEGSGTSLDTVVHARTICDDRDTELGCNEDILLGRNGSRVEILSAPASFFAFVDGVATVNRGAYELVAWYEPMDAEGSCAAPQPVTVMLDGPPVEQSGMTLRHFDDSAVPGCTADGAPDYAYLVTPPANGTLTVNVTAEMGSSWQPAIYAYERDCDGPLMGACDPGSGGSASVTFSATAMQTYTVVIDGGSDAANGAFTASFSLSSP